jgi:hypothetical protein
MAPNNPPQLVGEAPSADDARLEDVIRYLLNHHTYLHEKRIQKLIFLADLHSIQSRGKRLVDADFKRYYHGVYSDRIALALQSLDGVQTRPDVGLDGAATFVFLRPRKPLLTPTLGPEDEAILKEVLAAYKACTTDDLAEIGKTTVLWETAEFDQQLDYDAFLKDPSSRLPPQMKDAFEAALAERKRGRPKAYADVDEMMAASRS